MHGYVLLFWHQENDLEHFPVQKQGIRPGGSRLPETLLTLILCGSMIALGPGAAGLSCQMPRLSFPSPFTQLEGGQVAQQNGDRNYPLKHGTWGAVCTAGAPRNRSQKRNVDSGGNYLQRRRVRWIT